MTIARTVVVAFCVALALLPAARSFAQQAAPPILQPKTYASPSGESVLHVEPSLNHKSRVIERYKLGN